MGKDYDAAHKDANARIERGNDDDQVENSDTSGGESGAGGGEDDSSTEIEGDDSHLHEDQKSRRLEISQRSACTSLMQQRVFTKNMQ